MLLSVGPNTTKTGTANITIPAIVKDNLTSGGYLIELYLVMTPQNSGFYQYGSISSVSISRGSVSTSLTKINTSLQQFTEIGRNGILIMKDSQNYLRIGGVLFSNESGSDIGGFEVRCNNYGFMLHPGIGFMV